MKYYLDLVADFKQGLFAPVYLFFGPEGYLRQEAVKRLRDYLLPGDADDFNFITVDAQAASISEILSHAMMTTLFSEQRLVLVKNTNFFSSKKGTGQSDGESAEKSGGEESLLIKYLSQPSKNACIVFDAGESVDKRKKVFKEIAKAGKVIEFSLLRPEDLSAWLEKQARLSGKSLAPGTASEILARTGHSLQPLSLEIQKLISYTGESKFITPGDVAAVTPPNSEEDIFAVVDAIGNRNASRAIEGINRLIMQKQPPPAILAMVARQIRLILRAGEAVRAGVQAGELSPRLGIHPFVAKKMASQQRNFNRKQLINALFLLHRLDMAVKSGQQEFIPGVESFILNTCRKPQKK